MENCKRREFSLPPEIIAHIQSFMSGREAARTSILSKSLYNAWSKRPNLDFDDCDFRFHQRHLFSEFTKKTMQRYEYLNLKIVSFTLRMKNDYYCCSLAKELIVQAMKLGAIDLKIEFPVDFIDDECSPFVLPEEVFESETLDRLSVTGGIINLWGNVEVTRSKLKSVHLSQVLVKDCDLLRILISRCPSIEKLICDDLLFSFDLDLRDYLKLSRVLEYEFQNLRTLSLDTLKDKYAWFFKDMLFKFPCLKTLAIRSIYICSKIRICSQSLECISFVEYYKAVTAEFDVPNIRKFHFEGSALSCLSFETACRDDWESDIHIMCYQGSDSWLSSLKKLLQDLSLSKVSLSIHVKYPSKYICDYTRCEPMPVVENLKIVDHVPNSGLLDGLFFICRPKFVNLHCFASDSNDLLELLCTKLVDERSENRCIPNLSMHGLEEVIVELFEEKLQEWRLLPWKMLFDASTFAENPQKVRFRLGWRL